MTIRRIPPTASPPTAPTRDAAEAPTSVLALLDETLGDGNRTANAKELLTTAAKAVSRIVLSLGVALLAVAALAVAMARSPLSGPAIGSVVVILGGAGLSWGAHRLYQRIRTRQTAAPLGTTSRTRRGGDRGTRPGRAPNSASAE